MARAGALLSPSLRLWRACAFVCVLLALALAAAGRGALDDASTEYKVKAAFLYNFLKYAKWPERAFADANAPIVVAVVGNDPFGALLDDTLRDKSVGARKVAVRRFKSAQELGECHLLFVAASEAPKLERLLERCRGKAVLLVGESEKFAARGGAVGFFLAENKVHFEINVEAAKRAEIELSSQLLKLARLVKDGEGVR